MTRFLQTFPLRPHHRVLDVGGHADFWRNKDANAQITVLNLDGQPESSEPLGILAVVGDGTRLEYAYKSFDLVFSNSVVEHLGTFERQQRFASEAMRVGNGLWIQTRARTFPIEPHFLTPLIHFFPKEWRRRLARHFTVRGCVTRPAQADVDAMVEEIRLLWACRAHAPSTRTTVAFLENKSIFTTFPVVEA